MRLNIGCGPNIFPSENWVNYDREDMRGYIEALEQYTSLDTMPKHQANLTKYVQAGGKITFQVRDLRDGFPMHADDSVDAIYLGQMIEHINPIYEAPKFILECRRMLKPGGVLKITTPDLHLLIDAYNNDDMEKFAHAQPEFYKGSHKSAQLAYLMYGACGPSCTWDNYEGHMFLYTRESMSSLLSGVGFTGPYDFYQVAGVSRDQIMAEEGVDAGMSHSFATEAVK